MAVQRDDLFPGIPPLSRSQLSTILSELGRLILKDSGAGRIRLRAQGRVPMGIGRGSRISNASLDQNVRIGATVQLINNDRIQESDRSSLGFTLPDGTII